MLRKIKPDDEKSIKDLLSEFPQQIQENLNTELKQALNERVEGFVYVDDNQIAGYIVLRKWGGVYHLDTLVVKPALRGKGIGKALVQFSKEKCIEENIPQLNTCTFEPQNISFYQKLGFFYMGDLNGPFMPLEKKRSYFKWVNKDFKNTYKNPNHPEK